jgi:hypothetical protein
MISGTNAASVVIGGLAVSQSVPLAPGSEPGAISGGC